LIRHIATKEAKFRGLRKMPANREQVEQLVAAVPNFRSRWEQFLKDFEGDETLPFFVGIGELAYCVVDSYAQGVTAEFPKLFRTVEDLLQNPDPELENLITVGLFEDIQNIASHRDFGAAPFRALLGPRSLVAWDEIDAYMIKVAAWTAKNEPRWWQFWRRRVFNAQKALTQVESPALRKIIESDYRKMK
jgi:hypothetical protein